MFCEREKGPVCPYCNQTVPDRDLLTHLLAHQPPSEKPKPKNQGKTKHKLILHSRRGSRVEERGVCAECKKHSSLLWRYADSNKGTVFLCPTCKPHVFERSFGPVDALSVCVSGGGFETNKRKH